MGDAILARPANRCWIVAYAAAMKVREPVARPVDVIVAELVLSASQAFVVGVLLYLAVGVWDERGVDSGSIAAILVALAFAVGAAWLYWLLGGTGLPLAAAELPVALFLAFAGLLGLRGDELVRLEPVPLLLTLVSAVYGIAAGVFLDSPRRLRWDQRRSSRRQEPVPRLSPATAAWAARMGAIRSGAPTRRAPSAARIESTSVSRPPEPAPPPVVEAPRPVAPEPPRPAPTVAAPEVPAKPVAPPRPAPRSGGGGPSKPPGPVPLTGSAPGGPVELPTSVEPRAQRSPWAWARPPEWHREEETFEDDLDGDRA
jgi:hypothetical protein